MPFVAETAVQPLDYNFRPYLQANGTTPEPSDKEIRRFQLRIAASAKKAMGDRKIDTTDPNAVVHFVLHMSEDDYGLVNDEMIEATAELTKGFPSLEQISALPGRIQRAYILSLQEDLTNPEPVRPATST
jgi:hypothetical protein